MANEPPKIESAVEEKIDKKIEAAQLPPIDPTAPVSPKTTAEEDLESAAARAAESLKTSGQRKVNLIWEATQAAIAIMITVAVIYSALSGIKSEILNTAFVLVISMYLVRTNHSKVGGIGGTDSR